jgi:hypothetical protein
MQDFSTIILQPYVGVPYGYPAPFKSATGWIKFAPLFVDWAVYGASSTKNKIGITQDLKGTVAAQLIPKIVSVYIDNLGSNVPVYVRFPSTGFVIAAPPNSSDWYNCITQDLSVSIYGIGFVTGQIPKTNFYFTDAYVPPYSNFEQQNVIDKWLASASISRGQNIFNQDFGVPALGDQLQTLNYTKTTSNAYPSISLWGTPRPGFIYVQSFNLSVLNIVFGAGGYCWFRVRSLGLSGTLLYTPVFSSNNQPSTWLDFMFTGSACNIKLDATETWLLDVDPSPSVPANNAQWASMYGTSVYTQNPN